MAEKNKAPVSARAAGSDEKAKALETALAQIKKQYGEGAVMRLGQDSALNVEAVPTGSLSLDLALGIGGLPRGRIVEIYDQYGRGDQAHDYRVMRYRTLGESEADQAAGQPRGVVVASSGFDQCAEDGWTRLENNQMIVASNRTGAFRVRSI